MVRIGFIIGSTRPGRKGPAIAQWLLEIANKRGDAEYEIVDIADYNLPLLDEPYPASMKKYTKDHTKRWSAKIESLDGFVFITPEYNHSTPAALKNAIDYLFYEWNDKPAGFVSYGSAGGVRAVEALRLVLGELKVADVRAQVMLSLFTDFEGLEKFAPKPHDDSVNAMLGQVVAWARALKPLREGRK